MLTRSKKLTLAALSCIGIFLLSIAPATPNASAHQGAGDATQIQILMNEFSFQVTGQAAGAPLTLKAGQKYALVLRNPGKVAHEIMMGHDVMVTDGKPSGYEMHLLDGVQVVLKHSEMDEFAATAMGLMEVELATSHEITIEFTLPTSAKGTWEIGCFFAGHYQAGMKLPLIVE